MSIILTDADTATHTFVPNGFIAAGLKFIDAASSAASYVRELFVRHTAATPKQAKGRRNLRLETTKVVDGVPNMMSVDLTVQCDANWGADEVQDAITMLPTYFTSEADVGLFLVGGHKQ